MRNGRTAWGRVVAVAFVAGAATGCFTSVCETASTYCITPLADGGREQCMDYPGVTSLTTTTRVCAPVTPVVCAGTACGVGQACCLATGKCFDSNTSSPECPPAHAPTDAGTAGASCSSQSDCRPDEGCFKLGPNDYCIGQGVCRPRNECGTCGPVGQPQCQVCGCNGVTYESVQAACVAGVRYSGGPCGAAPQPGIYEPAGSVSLITCGVSSQCPSGSLCCGITGHCFDASQPWRCQPLADGGVPDCLTNVDCAIPFTTNYCEGTGCGTPGICRGAPRECGGEVVPVCGCNGITYTNECWARHAATRVASQGPCADAGR